MIIVLLLAFTSITSAQLTRTEIVNPSTPSEDAKQNSDTVPNVYTINGHFERILVVRFKNQADLLTGLESIVKEQKILNAVILSGIGSVTDYQIHTVSNRTFPSKNMYLKDTTSSADIVSMNGYIINGRIHAHISLADTEKLFGGHLEAGTKVFTFAVVTIGVFKDGINLRRVDDKTYR
jgi:Predicted DNA-binding protein with PD1-like DNA-binding motif